jgi:outer membrane protein
MSGSHLTPVIVLLLFIGQNTFAQNTSTNNLRNLLELAETNYPLLKAKKLDVQAVEKGIDISKGTSIPSLDAAYQMNYATYNNITGMNYPQLLMPISGPPSPDNQYGGVFGSALSLLANWQPITFGQRNSQEDHARAGLKYATADEANEVFAHKVRVINAYLDALTANELVKVHEENLKRAGANLSNIKTLVINGIKPGVDTALLNSEVSRAKLELLNSRKIRNQTQVTLSQLLASDTAISFTDSTYFTRLPFNSAVPDSITNPLVSLYGAGIDMSKARRKMLSKSTMPVLGTWASAYARGSGIDYTGDVKSTNGLGFQRYNYGLGFQLSVPILQFARIKPQLEQQDLIIASNQEKLNEILLQLKKQQQLANITWDNALEVAQESPLFYESASYSYRALQSRYQSGLANFADLVQAQYGLLKAETESRTSFVAVWKALLLKAAINGDLNLFLNEVK